MSNRFTDKAEKVLNGAAALAESLGHTYIGSEHLLLSICKEKDCDAAALLNKCGVAYDKVLGVIKDFSGVGAKSTLTPKDMTPRTRKIVECSYKISVRYGALKIGTEHLLLSILEEKECIGTRVLSLMGVDLLTLTDEIITVLRTAEKHVEAPKLKKENDTPLNQYGKNLTDLARARRLDPVIGRDKETERLIRVLSRKNKNNPCLIGEAGVGKTAIVEGLAIRIADGTVPDTLLNKSIISVDLTSMVAGAKYRGDFEERIKSIINEVVKNKNVILFIDEIHTIVGAGSAEGAIDAANILKPQLSRAEIQLIGATTISEYHKHIEKDSALERRFQSILVEEPSFEETLNILRGLKDRYEEHHSVKITENALVDAVRLSERYIQDRYFPDKALDVLDEACAKANIKRKENEKNKEESNDNKWQTRKNKVNVDSSDIIEIVKEMTGIEISGTKLGYDPRELERRLKDMIYGQDEAIESICKAVARSHAGINDPDKPKGVFLFTGPSGVGKTEISKLISEELFHDKKALIRYDMSEFSEKNSITTLIGSPPGYVGYEEGGSLTEKIRRHPYSVVLFDEIEKAHPDVLNLFLQIMDDGVLTDSCGRSVSFKNAYIIMTSNVLAGSLGDVSLGFMSSGNDKNEKLFEFFTPEFINRIDCVVRFSPLDIETVKRICQKRLSELKRTLTSMGVDVRYTENVCNYLSKKAVDKRLGARTLLRAITIEIETLISEFMIEGDLDEVDIDYDGNKIVGVPRYKIKK